MDFEVGPKAGLTVRYLVHLKFVHVVHGSFQFVHAAVFYMYKFRWDR